MGTLTGRPAPIEIDDAADPRLAPYLNVRERDLTGRGERFIVEGLVTLGVLVERGRFSIESVFVLERRLDAIGETLARLDPAVPVYCARQNVFDAVAGFHVHRGVLACARKAAPRAMTDLTGHSCLLAGFGISNHDNVGAMLRNAAALGAGGVILDGASCDPLYRKAIRVSAGTALWLPFVQGGAPREIIDELKTAGHTVWALTPRQSAPSLHDVPVPERLTILVGAEGPGLPDDILAACQPVRIPMASGIDSLNVATAAAIALAVTARGSRR